MSILDDAIREHLELKRAHGADEAEVKRLEDEAFGPPGRPDDADPLAEAPTEFLGTPPFDAAEVGEEPSGRRVPNITDLQEAPPAPREEEPAAEADTPSEAPAADAPELPDEEQQPAMEHQTIPVPHPEPPLAETEPAAEEDPVAEATPFAEAPPADEPVADAGPSTEEREAIADQPTEFFDVEAELQADAPDAAEKPSPTDDQLLDSQLSEPRLAPADPVAPLPSEELELPDEEPSDEYEEDDDEFFSEQRLSEELHQALDAPVTDEHEALPEHQPFVEPEPEDEPDTPPPPPAARVEEPTAIYDVEGDEEDDEGEEPNAYEPETGSHEDVLEDTPDFLEDAPEDDDLWFEQRPPKDFDFDD